MTFPDGLVILMKDWQEVINRGESKLSLADLASKLGADTGVSPDHNPWQVAELMEKTLKRTGELERAINFIAQFQTEKELLEGTDLYGLICALGIT